MLKKCAQIWDEVRAKTPLIHCITNYVTVNDVANIILAGGASPAMAENPNETESFAQIASALYLNVGSLAGDQVQAMMNAVKGADKAGVPIIIDPVACGAIPYKYETYNKLSEACSLTCIKGNSAEIKFLAGFKAEARGVDSLDTGEGLEQACLELAQEKQTVAVSTGAVDVIADYNNNLALVKNGTSLFGSITGAGCMVGGLVAACIGVNSNEPWLAAVTGLAAFNIAGERAYELSGENPGSFRVLLFDKLYNLRGEDIIKEARVEWRS